MRHKVIKKNGDMMYEISVERFRFGVKGVSPQGMVTRTNGQMIAPRDLTWMIDRISARFGPLLQRRIFE